MPAVPPSPKRQIVRAAERLFAQRGLDGVSLREVGAAAGSANNSAVQYHFGSKDGLLRAIFEYRLADLEGRRSALVAERRPRSVHSWVECQVLPILEQGEQRGSHYLSFVAMLQQHPGHRVLEQLPDELRGSTRTFLEQMDRLLADLPQTMRRHRISQVMRFSVYAGADRERARGSDRNALPFAVHASDLIEGLVAFLQAPVAAAARDALDAVESASLARAIVL